MNKYVAITVMLLLCMQELHASQYHRVNQDQIHVRTDSTVIARSLGLLAKNEKVEVIQENYEWYKIKLPKRFPAYVWKAYIKPTSGKKGEVIASRLNMRQEPSLEAPIIGQLPQGEIITINRSSGDWLEISAYPFAAGWVHKNFLIPDNKPKEVEVESGPDEASLSVFVTSSLASLKKAASKEKETLIEEIVSKGENVITLIDKEIDTDNENFTNDIINIFTRLGKANPTLISYFIKKAESPSIVLASVYLTVLQNILETKKEKTAYYHFAKQGKLAATEVERVRKKYQKIHEKNILSRKKEILP